MYRTGVSTLQLTLSALCYEVTMSTLCVFGMMKGLLGNIKYFSLTIGLLASYDVYLYDKHVYSNWYKVTQE